MSSMEAVIVISVIVVLAFGLLPRPKTLAELLEVNQPSQ